MNPSDLLHHRYRIQEQIGSGGFATTWLALDEETGKRCVVKRLMMRHVDSWKAVELFQREAGVLSHLSHPLIPACTDYFTLQENSDTHYVMVRDFAEGRSLQEVVQAGKHFTEEEAQDLLKDLLDILVYLHGFSPPIIHRDIKPANIILGEDQRPRLIDFGAVKDKIEETTLGGTTAIGTLGYMPYEQFEGRVGKGADIYALAATMVYVLSHREPSQIGKVALKLDFHTVTDLSEGFADLLDSMLEPDPKDRADAADELRMTLGRLTGEIEQAPVVETATRQRRQRLDAPQLPKPMCEATLFIGDKFSYTGLAGLTDTHLVVADSENRAEIPFKSIQRITMGPSYLFAAQGFPIAIVREKSQFEKREVMTISLDNRVIELALSKPTWSLWSLHLAHELLERMVDILIADPSRTIKGRGWTLDATGVSFVSGAPIMWRDLGPAIYTKGGFAIYDHMDRRVLSIPEFHPNAYLAVALSQRQAQSNAYVARRKLYLSDGFSTILAGGAAIASIGILGYSWIGILVGAIGAGAPFLFRKKATLTTDAVLLGVAETEQKHSTVPIVNIAKGKAKLITDSGVWEKLPPLTVYPYILAKYQEMSAGHQAGEAVTWTSHYTIEPTRPPLSPLKFDGDVLRSTGPKMLSMPNSVHLPIDKNLRIMISDNQCALSHPEHETKIIVSCNEPGFLPGMALLHELLDKVS